MPKILIVDDSPTDVESVTRILEKHSQFEIHRAENAVEGIERATELLPDLILMDVVMPGMNGFQATRKLSRAPKTKHIPIIILTTKDQETDKIWGIRQGAKDYSIKPVSEEELMSKINALI